MKRILVYSHDTYGLGNIRRMLSICTYLIEQYKDLSILIISGSPMIHSFKVPNRIDYLKLPCLNRSKEEGYTVKFLGTQIDETILLRAELIRSAIVSFKPDLFLVDKKPLGINNELEGALNYLKRFLPSTKIVLLLRDILDKPASTIRIWTKNRYYDLIERFYDLVLVVGNADVFNVCKEYQFPESVSKMVRFCGYISREPGQKKREQLRRELELKDEKLVLVTPGGGQDGLHLLETYIAALNLISNDIKTLVISGPEMPSDQKTLLMDSVKQYPSAKIIEFTDDMMSYMDAADLVIAMGGYNTVCEILTLKKRAIIVPRVKPVEEQAIRAGRMGEMQLFRTIHPDDLSPQLLTSVLIEELYDPEVEIDPFTQLVMDALPIISELLTSLYFLLGCLP